MAKGSLQFESHVVDRWQSFIGLASKRFRRDSSFIFRGQAVDKNSHWIFQTELERAWLRATGVANVNLKQDVRKALKSRLEERDINAIEDGLIREFHRKSSLYLKHQPSDHRLDWLALMRHYAGPTRLHDWTYSIYVAAFFAIDRCSRQKPASIWALDTSWVKSRMSKIEVHGRENLWDVLYRDTHLQNPYTWDAYLRGAYRFVLPVNPFKLHKRLVIQQGLFVCPGNLSIPFEDNLLELQQKDPKAKRSLIEIRLNLNAEFEKDFLTQLYRMNITRESLYPGLQGFAQSLSMRLLFPKVVATESFCNTRRMA